MTRIILLNLLIFLSACAKSKSQTKAIARNTGGVNKALLVGAATNLPGIDLDLAIVEKILQSQPGSYQIAKSYDKTSTVPQTPAEIQKLAVEQAKDADTFVFFFSGHGSNDGRLLAGNKDLFHLGQVLEAIKKARGKPLPRLVIWVDACFSGNLVNGSNSVVSSQLFQTPEQLAAQQEIDSIMATHSKGPAELMFAGLLADVYGVQGESDQTASVLDGFSLQDTPFPTPDGGDSETGGETSSITEESSGGGGLYKQLFIMTSSSATQTSNATSVGSAFTVGLRDAYNHLAGSSGQTATTQGDTATPNPIQDNGSTFQDLVSRTKQNVGQQHTPQHAFDPPALAGESLQAESQITADGTGIYNPYRGGTGGGGRTGRTGNGGIGGGGTGGGGTGGNYTGMRDYINQVSDQRRQGQTGNLHQLLAQVQEPLTVLVGQQGARQAMLRYCREQVEARLNSLPPQDRIDQIVNGNAQGHYEECAPYR